MAALNFPSSPTDGQTHTENGRTWTYSSTAGAWRSNYSSLSTITAANVSGAYKFTASASTPASPSAGDEWWDTDDGSFWKYIYDGTTFQWVEWGPNSSLNGTELITGNLIPNANVTYNLGSTSFRMNTIFGQSTSAQYADLAEKFLADDDYSIGTVLMLGGDQEVTIATKDSRSLVGVVSDKPAFIMNDDLEGKHVKAIAYIGRVLCKVTGVVNKGDILVVSEIPGVATSTQSFNDLSGRVVGKALEDNFNKELIEIVVGRL